jgi:hypothetical protein
MSDHFVGVLGLFATIIFGPPSLYLAFRSLAPKILVWGLTTEIISTSGSHGEFGITFRDRTLSEIRIAKIAIWNGGRSSMSGSEISKVDPLSIVLPAEAELLSVSTLGQTSDGVGICAESNPTRHNEVDISFDILNEREGSAIRLLFCGPSSELRIKGTIRDVKRLVQTNLPSDLTQSSVTPRRITVASVLVTSMFGLIMLATTLASVFGVAVYSSYFAYSLALFAALAVIALAFFIAIENAYGLPDALRSALARDESFQHSRD